MGNEEKLIKNTAILALGTFLPKLASFAILPILTGRLTQEEYGTYDLIIVLVSLFLPAVTLQIQTAAFRFLIDVKGNKAEETSIITNIFAYTLPASVAAVAVLFFALRGIDSIERILICLYFICDITANTERQIVRGLSRNKYFSISAILGSLGQFAFVVIFVLLLDGGLVGATLSLIVASLCESVYLFLGAKLYQYINPKAIDKLQIKKMLQYSWPMVPNSMSMWVMRVSDRLVISIFLGVASNAIYAAANKIPSILTIAQNTFSMAWQENASVAIREKDSDAYYCRMFRSFFDFMAGAFGMLVAVLPVLFAVLVKGDYGDAYIQIPILLMASFFFSLTGYLGGIYVAYMKTKSVGITTAVSAVCNLVINLTLIHFIGLYAASVSTLVSYILLTVYRMIDVQRFVKIKYDVGHILLILSVLAVMSGLAMMQTLTLNLLNVVIGAALFAILDGKMVFHFAKKALSRIKK